MNPDVLKKILKLRFLLLKKSKRSFLGFYTSAFKGSGIAFRDFREYARGDDVRSISWLLTAKMGKPYVKNFEEDRGGVFIVMVDVSGSSHFGSGAVTKLEAQRQIASLIVLSAEFSRDQIGMILFSDRVEHYTPPSKGQAHTMRVVKDLYSRKALSKKTNYEEPSFYLNRVLKKRSTIFILSDFLTQGFEKPLKLLRQRHDVTAVVVEDPLEADLPPLGLVDFEDMETGKIRTVDAGSKGFQKNYKKAFEKLRRQRDQRLTRTGLGFFSVRTDEDVFKPFLNFMRQRG